MEYDGMRLKLMSEIQRIFRFLTFIKDVIVLPIHHLHRNQ